MIFLERELLFRGSLDRLKRNVTKQGGCFPAPGTFRMIWRSPYFKWGLAFRMDSRYEKGEEGYRIRYRFLPTWSAMLWMTIPVVLLWYYVFWDFRNGGEGALAVSLFSLLYPTVALWQYLSCHKAMRRFFAVQTQ